MLSLKCYKVYWVKAGDEILIKKDIRYLKIAWNSKRQVKHWKKRKRNEKWEKVKQQQKTVFYFYFFI